MNDLLVSTSVVFTVGFGNSLGAFCNDALAFGQAGEDLNQAVGSTTQRKETFLECLTGQLNEDYAIRTLLNDGRFRYGKTVGVPYLAHSNSFCLGLYLPLLLLEKAYALDLVGWRGAVGFRL